MKKLVNRIVLFILTLNTMLGAAVIPVQAQEFIPLDPWGYTVEGDYAVDIYPKHESVIKGNIVIGDTGFRNREIYPGVKLGDESNKYQIYDFRLNKWLIPYSIKEEAFIGCGEITSVEIPETVVSIGKKAFAECNGIETIVFKNGLQSIGEQAFFGANNLVNITIPNSVTSIGAFAFYVSNKTGIGNDILITNLTTINPVAEKHDWIGDHRNFNYHKVTFDTNGGEPEVEPQDVRDGGRVTEPTGIKKEGENLYGWYEGTEFKPENIWVFETDTVSEDTKLTCKWVKADVYKQKKQDKTVPETEWQNPLSELKRFVLNQKETSMVESGEANIIIRLDLEKPTNSLEHEKAQEFLRTKEKDAKVLGTYDISLSVLTLDPNIDTNNYKDNQALANRKIHVLENGTADIIMDVPEKFKEGLKSGYTRTLYMSGAHNIGTEEEPKFEHLTVKCEMLENNKFKAKLSKFSIYEIGYYDTKNVTPSKPDDTGKKDDNGTSDKSSNNSNNGTKSTPIAIIPFINVPVTGDQAAIGVVAILMIAAIGAYVVVQRKSKKKGKTEKEEDEQEKSDEESKTD